MTWLPSSDALEYRDGVWTSKCISPVSYPSDGNSTCLQVEDSSYWFAHRNQIILSAIASFPPSGTIYDVGGGNGFVSVALQKAGCSVALLEPGDGAMNAIRRGVRNVIRATLVDARLGSDSVPAVCLCDVLEHIQDDHACLREIKRILRPDGRLYCTVPVGTWLWCNEDVQAGHFRRYSRSSLAKVLGAEGFEIEYITHFFSYLPAPILLLRVLPHLLRGRSKAAHPAPGGGTGHHRLPSLLIRVAATFHRIEVMRIKRGRIIPFGSSLLCVAKVH